MKVTIFLLLVLLCGIALLPSCKRNGGISHVTIDADLKAAFDFKPGTYWIYRDSISGRVDSFAVRNNTLISTNVAGNATIDEIVIFITEYIGGSPADTSPWQILLFANCEELVWESDINFNGQKYFDLDPLFIYPFKTGPPQLTQGLFSGENLAVANNIYPNYMVGVYNYMNIVELNSYGSNGTYTTNYWFYVAGNIGIIKMRLYNTYYTINKVWEMQRCNIVK